MWGLPNDVNGGNGGGGFDWANSIYMVEGPESCPSEYDKIDPAKPELYGDVPEVNVAATRDADNVADDWADGHSASLPYASESLGYSPYKKIDNPPSTAVTSQQVADWCATECSKDNNCAAMATDGLSACFLYNKDNLPTPYRTPGPFITCRKKTPNYFVTGFRVENYNGIGRAIKYLGNSVKAFTTQGHAAYPQYGHGKLQDETCTSKMYGLPNDDIALYGENGGGGIDWANSIYMVEGPESCPSEYDKIDPAKPELYGDVPEVNVAATRDADNVADDWADGHSASLPYASESLGYSPYKKIDNPPSTAVTSQEVANWCGTECTNDVNCLAMASDGLKRELELQQRTKVQKLAEFLVNGMTYMVDNAVVGSTKIADAETMEAAVANAIGKRGEGPGASGAKLM
eukprot:g13548.t1